MNDKLSPTDQLTKNNAKKSADREKNIKYLSKKEFKKILKKVLKEHKNELE